MSVCLCQGPGRPLSRPGRWPKAWRPRWGFRARGGDALQRESGQDDRRAQNPGKSAPEQAVLRGLNLGAATSVQGDHQVVPGSLTTDEQAKYARQVARPAKQLRRYFQNLGFGVRAETRASSRQKSAGSTPCATSCLRGDPRILIPARCDEAPTRHLFWASWSTGSGSMAGARHGAGPHVSAQFWPRRGAASPASTADLRLPDRVIYGTPARKAMRRPRVGRQRLATTDAAGCGTHPGGARRTSDKGEIAGDDQATAAPNGVQGGRAVRLGQRVSRRSSAVAQVAVMMPLVREICFPHYVLLQEKPAGHLRKAASEPDIRVESAGQGYLTRVTR